MEIDVVNGAARSAVRLLGYAGACAVAKVPLTYVNTLILVL